MPWTQLGFVREGIGIIKRIFKANPYVRKDSLYIISVLI